MSGDEPDCWNTEFRVEIGSSGASLGYVDSEWPRATRNGNSVRGRSPFVHSGPDDPEAVQITGLMGFR